MITVHIFYHEEIKKYGVSFFNADSDNVTELSFTAWLTQQELESMKAQISQAEKKCKTKQEQNTDVESILKAYIECAVWSSLDEHGTPLDDKKYADCILSEDTRQTMREEIIDFLVLLENEGIAWQEHMTLEQFGHDFWLTRNGHGAGFWDRGLGKLGETLTKWSKTYGSCDLEIGDNRQIYMM